jgi:leucyl aminopeptidase
VDQLLSSNPEGAPREGRAVPIHLASTDDWERVKARLPAAAARFADAMDFQAQAGRHLVVPDSRGRVSLVLHGVEPDGARRRDPFGPGRLSSLLPEGDYVFRGKLHDPASASLSWLLSAYRYEAYKPSPLARSRLVAPRGVDVEEVSRIAEAVRASRDLVNAPANDLGPEEIEAAIRLLAAGRGAEVRVVAGDALLAENFPMIHAVGRASPRAPRLIDLSWGAADAPKVTLVGKGVAFDTGGLNIKPDNAMLLMKKDMGGAASAIAAARMIMDARLPVRLRLLVPAVENAISGNAFRPGDVLPSRKGLSVEIGNTDAEGRLILADALALADEEAPALIADFATLTGAARVALGPDLPPFYTHDEKLAADLARLSKAVNDPVWRLPLWAPYDALLDSRIASLNHISGGPFAGSITAALFLARFVEKASAHVHFDIFAWNPSARPGRPEGGEVQAARLIHALVKERHPRPGP